MERAIGCMAREVVIVARVMIAGASAMIAERADDREVMRLPGQMGQMLGWLQSWGLSLETDRPQLEWLPADSGHVHNSTGGALMPGMATPAELRHELSAPARQRAQRRHPTERMPDDTPTPADH